MTAAARRLPILGAGAVALLAGLFAGLARLGWEMPAPALAARLVDLHGPLMVCGFFGTVIGLERAVAFAKPWAFAAPLLSGLGAIGLLVGLPVVLGGATMLGGALIFLAVAGIVAYRHRALYTLTLALGAAAWPAGLAAWLIADRVGAGVAAWGCFLLLTIAGERLELSRFLPPSRWKAPGAVLAFGLLLAGSLLTALELSPGDMLFGIGLLALAIWLLRHDVVRRTVRQSGLTRYMAICLLSGYFWLAAAGAITVACGLPEGGPFYDAILHSLFVGFVFAMVFGHVPVILPAVLRLPMPFHPGLYTPLVLLHASLLLRVAGDLGGIDAARRWGGMLGAVVILGFLLLTAATVATAARRRPPTTS